MLWFCNKSKTEQFTRKNLKKTITRSLNLFLNEAVKYLNNHFDFDKKTKLVI